MNRSLVFLLVVLLGEVSCTTAQSLFSRIPQKAELFADGIISTSANERDFALSPDGNEMFYTLQAPRAGMFQTILHRVKNAKGVWSKPAVAPFAGNFTDLEPAFSPDGRKLFFCSNRPLSGERPKDFDIWVVEKTVGKWGEPKNIGRPVNTELDEFYPSVAGNGNLYFTAAYKSGVGREDIFVSKFQEGTYQPPVPLGPGVNSTTYEFNAYVSPQEEFIIFTSYGREDDSGGGDLYISLKDENGQWKTAINLKELNSSKMDYCPFVSADKKILFFTSERNNVPAAYKERTNYRQLNKYFTGTLNGSGNIYWVDFELLLARIKGEK
jgi:Tol biopolymer transport system component